MLQQLKRIFFYGNIFAALCAVSLCIETNYQHGIPRNGIPFYLIVFLGTIFYYNLIYVRSVSPYNWNDRVIWYREHRKKLIAILFGLGVTILGLFIFLFIKYFESFKVLNILKWGLLVVFPFIAIAYTFQVLPFPKFKKLRRIGWLKPVVIGFTWSGFVTVYPVLFWQIQIQSQAENFVLPSGLLWLENMIFITALAIMFDIKDYSTDMRQSLRTIPVQIGIEKTVRFIIQPLIILSVGILIFYYFRHHQIQWPILMAIIPFLLMLRVGKDLSKTKNIYYYLFTIDGLMLLKALAGIFSIYLLQNVTNG